ncbi:MAG: hypothetical protein AABZ08_04995 [Planctomycetota bacterium]
MNAFRLTMLLSLIAGPSIASAQTVLYWHPSSGSNAAIDDMVDDMESNGATVTSTSVEEDFYKATLNGPWDLVLAADQTVDIEEEHVAEFLAGGGEIYVLTSQAGDDVLIDLISTVRAMTQVSKDIPGTIACFLAWTDCRINCALTTPPFTPARSACDAACNTSLNECLAA